MTVAVFLDIVGALSQILLEDLESIGIPANLRKFYDNLISFRKLHFVNNGSLLPDPLFSHKGTPQGSISSPTLFNIYLRNIPACRDQNIRILQYADDLVIYASGPNVDPVLHRLQLSVCRITSFLRDRNLVLAPSKSKFIIFNRKKSPISPGISLKILGEPISRAYVTRFLGVVLDHKLSGGDQILSLIRRGSQAVSVISSLRSTWWRAHPSLLLNLYLRFLRCH